MPSAAAVQAPVRAPTLAPIVVAFVCFGAFVGAWSVAAADVEAELGVSHGGFGLVLSLALGLAAAANIFVGPAVDRFGTRRVLVVSLCGWSAALAALAVTSSAVLVVALAGVFAFAGAVDVAMNVSATTALAARPGSLVRFHGLFNAGAAAGAVATAAVVASSLSWRAVWACVSAMALGLAVVLALTRDRLTLHGPEGSVGRWRPALGLSMLRRPALAVVAVAFAGGALVEGGIDTWGVLFLRERAPAGLWLGAAAAASGFLIAGAARVLLGPRVGARGAPRGVTIGAALAGGGLVVMAVSPVPVLKAAGMVAAAAGISMSWPLLLSVASSLSGTPGAVVGAVSGVGYLGFVVGPFIVGAIADAAGLPSGLLFVAVVAMVVAAVPVAASRLWERERRSAAA